jgi:ribosomal protein S18 acetylase RimI-like enzyme
LQRYQGEWYLEVRASNREALNLYESLHFKRVAVRNNYYKSPLESAIVMRIFS